MHLLVNHINGIIIASSTKFRKGYFLYDYLEIKRRKLERNSKQEISRLNDLLYRLNDMIRRLNDIK